MAILNRIRGNPEGLSTIVVVILALLLAIFIAFAIADFDKERMVGAFSGAFLGTAVSAMAALLIRFLAEPDLRTAPRTFLDAAIQDVHSTGYYCRDSRFMIELIELEDGKQLVFSYSSTITPMPGSSKMQRPKVVAPDGLTLFSVDYTHNSFPKAENAPIPLDGNTREECEIVYYIINPEDPIKIEDEHRWRCPVEGFELTVKLPLKYKIEAFTLRGEHRETLNEVTSHTAGERRFAQRGALFSHQGFLWSIDEDVG